MEWQNLAFGRGFVNISAMFSSVGTYLMEIFLFSTASWMKWYWISICLVQAWNLFFDNAITPWLSHFNVTGLLNPLISPINVCKYIASFVAWVCAMYSTSVLDNVTMYCFFELQVMAPVPMWKEYPEIKCLCGCPAQSASQKPLRIFFLSHQTSARGLWWFLGKWLTFHSFSVCLIWVLHKLRQIPNCEYCICPGNHHWP